MKFIYFLAILIVPVVQPCEAQSSIDTNHYPFEVKKMGNGKQTIVLIPGFACSGDVWNETIQQLGPAYTCYALTMAGFAGVPMQAGASFKNWEVDIAAFIKDKNLVKPVVIGHSMGGAMAMALAADYPDLIGKIVVVDALPCLAAVVNPGFKESPSPDCTQMVSRITGLSSDEFLQIQKMSIGRLVTDTTKAATIIQWSVASDRSTFGGMYCDFSHTDLRAKIGTIHCPNLVMLEPYFSNIQSQIDQQFGNWKNANIHYATKGLHFIMFDDKDWYFEQLKNFLKS